MNLFTAKKKHMAHVRLTETPAEAADKALTYYQEEKNANEPHPPLNEAGRHTKGSAAIQGKAANIAMLVHALKS